MADADLVKDTYRKRAAVIGFRCGVVAMLLEGAESESVVRFATAMAQYVLDGQLKIFGNTLRSEFKKASEEAQRETKNANVFDILPPTFNIQDLQQAKGTGISRTALLMIICRWKKSNWIKKIGINQWTKCKQNEG